MRMPGLFYRATAVVGLLLAPEIYGFAPYAPLAARARGGITCSAAKEGTLYDFPVSNNGGRVRVIIYDKKLPIEVSKPEDLKAINPQAKVPTFKDEKTGLLLPESDTIVRHLLDRFSEGHGPSYRPSTLEARTKADLIARFHDTYITPIQGLMYKASPPFGPFDDREAALKELKRQLAILEDLADPQGPYLTGSEKSIADATLFPTGVFLEQILPNHYGWSYQEVFGPKLMKWWDYMLAKEPAYKKVHDEILKGIQGWEEKRRWSTILGADLQDLASATIFDKILSKQIPADIVYEDDKVLAFNDISPQAPRHILVIPKRRQGLTQLRKATEEQKGVLGHLLVAVSKIAAQEKLDGYRVVINDGESAGQSVFHLHLHILSGRPLAWPPG